MVTAGSKDHDATVSQEVCPPTLETPESNEPLSVLSLSECQGSAALNPVKIVSN